MTRDEIIALANKLDVLDEQHYGTLWVDKLVRFADEVERKARADTREACAAKLDSIAQEDSDCEPFVWAAAAIRALGAK